MTYDKSLAKHTALSAKTRPSKELLSFIGTYEDINPRNTVILDFGAGNGRHSNALREMGFTVYSYDPFNGELEVDPYEEVSVVLPKGKFDLVLSAFVLNVVSYEDMLGILNRMESLTKDDGFTIHIVREDLRKLKGGDTVGKKGSIQRDIPTKQLTDLGYERIGKVFVK